MNRGMVLSGAALVAVGAILLLLLWTQGSPAEVSGVPPATDSSVFAPETMSRVWAVGIGLIVATGAGLIGIGMNRWKRQGQ
jgi:hypothetical protein